MESFECVYCDHVFLAQPAFSVGCPECHTNDGVFPTAPNADDDAVAWDSFVLTSAGWGTDEDYGYYEDADYDYGF